MRLLAISLLTLTTACGAFSGGGRRDEPAPATRAQADMRNSAGQSVGQVTLEQTASGLLIMGTLSGMPAGTHAIHVHEIGACTPDFEAAGAHFNPTGREHGVRNAAGPHAGDMPNIHVAENGSARFEHFARDLSLSRGGAALLDANGSALVIHAVADDYMTQPGGNSGARIACGVVGR
jgi:Cu-Zn family superoxide dismutase